MLGHAFERKGVGPVRLKTATPVTDMLLPPPPQNIMPTHPNCLLYSKGAGHEKSHAPKPDASSQKDPFAFFPKAGDLDQERVNDNPPRSPPAPPPSA